MMNFLDKFDVHIDVSEAVSIAKCWELKLNMLCKFSIKTLILVENVKSNHLTKLKHKRLMISSSIIDDTII